MDPEDFFRVADFIGKINLEFHPEEILYRTAINRLYYGIFHLIQKKLGIIVPESQMNRCHAYLNYHCLKADGFLLPGPLPANAGLTRSPEA